MNRFCLLIVLGTTLLALLSCEPELGERNLEEGVCWYADRSLHMVGKISAEGDRVLLRYTDLVEPVAVACVPFDGSVWIADVGAQELVRLSLDGDVMRRVAGFASPIALAVDPLEEVLWVIDTANNSISRVGPRGTHLSTYYGLQNPLAVSVDRDTGEAWVADGNAGLVRIASDGISAQRFGGLGYVNDVSVDVYERRLYIADPKNNKVTCLRPTGEILWVFTGVEGSPLLEPTKVQAAPEGTVWVIDRYLDEGVYRYRIQRIGSAGLTIISGPGYTQNTAFNFEPVCLAMRWSRDEVWVGDLERHRVYQCAKDGAALDWVSGLGQPVSVSVYESVLDR